MGWEAWVAPGFLFAVLSGGGLWLWRLATALARTDGKAKAAEVLAAGLSVKVSNLEHELAAHKEHVASEYVSRAALEDVIQAINRLGDRLDGLFLHFIPKK